MNSVISFYNSNLCSQKLETPFEYPQVGDVLYMTPNVYREKVHFKGHNMNVESFIFETGDGKQIKLRLSEIIRAGGEFGRAIRIAIQNKDITDVRDLFNILCNNPLKVVDKGEIVTLPDDELPFVKYGLKFV